MISDCQTILGHTSGHSTVPFNGALSHLIQGPRCDKVCFQTFEKVLHSLTGLHPSAHIRAADAVPCLDIEGFAPNLVLYCQWLIHCHHPCVSSYRECDGISGQDQKMAGSRFLDMGCRSVHSASPLAEGPQKQLARPFALFDMHTIHYPEPTSLYETISGTIRLLFMELQA